MSNKEKLPEFIDRYNNGELTPEELVVFSGLQKHYPRLSEEIKLDRELNAMLTGDDTLELRKKILFVREKSRKGNHPDLRILLMAASFLAFLAIEFLLFFTKEKLHNPGKEEEFSHKIQPASKQHPENKIYSITALNTKPPEEKTGQMLPVHFRENPTYENLIGASRSGEHFRMVSPGRNDRIRSNSTINFKWIIGKNSEVDLNIIDNRGRIVKESGMIRENSYSLQPGVLLNGLYYYQLTVKGEIIYFGKFTVVDH